MEGEQPAYARIAGSDFAALSSEEQELVMKIRHVFGALTVTAITCGMTAGVSIVRAQDHHDPFLSSTSPEAVQQSSPEAVQQSSPQAVEPVVVEQTSPRVETVNKDTPRDPYILKTSPKAPKVKKVKHEKEAYSGLPKGHITIVGCFYRDVDGDGDHAHYMLADAKMGPATAVADQNCTPSGAGQLIRLKDADDVGLTQVASNRWVELYGEMGSPKDADDARKFEVKSFREVPLAQRPRIAILIPPAPAPRAAVETPPAQEVGVTESPKPMATSGETPYERKLPKTASELPLIALLGLFALAGGLVLGLVDRQKVLGRG
jgi:LPXTG-motif cell wall-anchored protein